MVNRYRESLRFLALFVVVLAVSVLLHRAGRGDEKADRERKAKVALALAAKPAPATAPAPRPAPKCYATGYAKAVTDAQPLVVFVGCQSWPVEGAVTAKTETPFAGVRGPAVVVGFPQADRLYIDSTLPGLPDAERVDAAVKAAQRKIDVPPAKPMPAAPKPLDWNL